MTVKRNYNFMKKYVVINWCPVVTRWNSRFAKYGILLASVYRA